MNYEKKYIKYKKKYLNLKNNMRGSSDPLKKLLEQKEDEFTQLIEKQAEYKKVYTQNLDKINKEENETYKLFLELGQRFKENDRIMSHLPIKDLIKKKKPLTKQFSISDRNKFDINQYKEDIKKIFKNLIEQNILDEEEEHKEEEEEEEYVEEENADEFDEEMLKMNELDGHTNKKNYIDAIKDEKVKKVLEKKLEKDYIKELFEILAPHYNLFLDWFYYLEKLPNFKNLEGEKYMKKLKIYFEDNPSNLYFDLLIEYTKNKSDDLKKKNIRDVDNIIYRYFEEIAIDPSQITNPQIIEKIENRHKFIDEVFEGGICEFFKLDLIANTIKQDEDEINNLKEEEERRINALRTDDATKEKIKEEIKKKKYPYPLFHRDNNLIYQYDYDKLIKEGVKKYQLEKCLNDNFISKKIKKSIYEERILKKLTDEIEKLDDHTKKKEYIEAIRDEEVKKELYKILYDVKLCETTKNKPEPSRGRKNRIKEEEDGKLKFKDNRSKLEITLKNKIKKYREYFSIEDKNFCMLKNGHFFEKIDEGKDLFEEIHEKKFDEKLDDKVVTAVYLFFKFDLIDFDKMNTEKKEQFKLYLRKKKFDTFKKIGEKVKKYLST